MTAPDEPRRLRTPADFRDLADDLLSRSQAAGTAGWVRGREIHEGHARAASELADRLERRERS